jgi:hypothetical protein
MKSPSQPIPTWDYVRGTALPLAFIYHAIFTTYTTLQFSWDGLEQNLRASSSRCMVPAYAQLIAALTRLSFLSQLHLASFVAPDRRFFQIYKMGSE